MTPHRPSSVVAVPGIRRLSPDELGALADTAVRARVQLDWLASVISIESGFRPSATNPATHATGLIQFMPSTARAYLGKPFPTTVAALRRMTVLEQLPFVETFYARAKGRLHSAGQTYMWAFLPAYTWSAPSHVLFRRSACRRGRCGPKSRCGYCVNRGLDRDGDGTITVRDVTRLVEAVYGAAASKPRIEIPAPSPASPPPTGSAAEILADAGMGLLGGLVTVTVYLMARRRRRRR